MCITGVLQNHGRSPHIIIHLKDNHWLLLGAIGVMYRVDQYPSVDKHLFHRKGNEIFREGM